MKQHLEIVLKEVTVNLEFFILFKNDTDTFRQK